MTEFMQKTENSYLWPSRFESNPQSYGSKGARNFADVAHCDWPRHSDNCFPVMVKEYGEKGKGLVAAKDIREGELILIDKAAVSNDDIELAIYGYTLTHDAERLLINRKILKDISLLNHSCAPNAAMGLLDGKENEAVEKRFELRAVKDISKEDEVTIFYPQEHDDLPWLHDDMRNTIQEEFGFDCKCTVCLGEVPNQDDIMRKMLDILNSNRESRKDEDEMNLSDWTKEAIAYEPIIELAKAVYMGRPEGKMANLLLFLQYASKARNVGLLEKAVNGIKELAEKTGLEVFKETFQEFSSYHREILIEQTKRKVK